MTERSTSQRRRGMGLAALVLATLLSLGVAELGVRIAAPQAQSWLAIYRRHPTLPTFSLMPMLHATVDTGETHWSVTTDADGFRVSEIPAPDAKCTILWLGDSFAFGHGVEFEESIAGQLLATVPGARLSNAAVPGYGPVQYRQTLDYLLDEGRNFDYVYVLTYVGNDFHDALWDKDVAVRDGVVGDSGDARSFVKRYSHLYRLASAVYHRFATPEESAYRSIDRELADPAQWERDFLSRAAEKYESELSVLLERARARGIEPRFVILPTQAAVAATRAATPAEPGENPLLPVEKARASLERLHAQAFDATDVLAEHADAPLYFAYDGHLTPLGGRVVAEALLASWPLECPPQGRSAQ